MARPYWFKLFGPDAPTTLSELRTALLTAPIGEGIGSGQFMANVRALLNLPPAPARPSPRDPERPLDTELGDRQSALVVLTGQDTATLPVDVLAAVAASQVGLAGSTGPEPQPAAEVDADRIISLQVGMEPNRNENPGLVTAEGVEQLGQRDGFSGGWLESYVRFYAQQQQGTPGFAFSNASPEELAFWASVNGPSDPRLDTLALSGDFSAGFNLSRLPADVTELALGAGNDYALELDDSFVGAGRTLTIHGDSVGLSGHVIFDGSAETDGSFSFLGSGNGDFFFGGAGDDVVRGNGGADTLSGGDGDDTFVYQSAGESTGAAFDILADFDPAADRIDLPVTVTGFDAAVAGGTLSVASAAADLAAALGGLGAGHAVLFTPDAGDLAGAVFLVVDGNGVAGYQEGEDYVFALPGTPPADLAAHPDFII